MGFYYEWVPPPPKEWLLARREWCGAVRHILRYNRQKLDSPSLVRDAVARGQYDGKWVIKDGVRAFSATIDALYARWIAVEPTYRYTKVPSWIDDTVVTAALDWLLDNEGILWVGHIAVGKYLTETARLRGLDVPYFHNEGLDAQGRFIDDWRGPCVASVAANSAGRNLQHHSTQLVLSPPTRGDTFEQLLGRTHRDGQKADTVECYVTFGCSEHLDAWDQAQSDAHFVQDTMGQEQKLLYADVLFDRQAVRNAGAPPRWV
jgi:hypothetical protein